MSTMTSPSSESTLSNDTLSEDSQSSGGVPITRTDSGNTAPANGTSVQTGTLTRSTEPGGVIAGNGTNLQAENLARSTGSAGLVPASRPSFPAATLATSTGTTPPHIAFTLIYDATKFASNETTDEITHPRFLNPLKIAEHPLGTLGDFFSLSQAKRAGIAWLYQQLSRLPDQVALPLPRADPNEFPIVQCVQGIVLPMPNMLPNPGTWRRSTWINDSYTVADKGRFTDNFEEISLTVMIVAIDVGAAQEEDYQTDEEPDDRGNA